MPCPGSRQLQSEHGPAKSSCSAAEPNITGNAADGSDNSKRLRLPWPAVCETLPRQLQAQLLEGQVLVG